MTRTRPLWRGSRRPGSRASGTPAEVGSEGGPGCVQGGAKPDVPVDRRAQARVELAARLLLEYDGGGFAGWARQPGQRTVQGVLEDALATVTGDRVELVVAGRTDSGVHARGQVASHAGEPVDAARLNGWLPGDVAVVASEAAPAGFDARRHARSRTYRYRVLARATPSPLERGRSLWLPAPLERGALRSCAGALRGRHDFTAFTPTQTEHVRFERDVLHAQWIEEPDCVLAFWIEADAFLRHMVRILVGTMLDTASGRRGVEDFARLLCGGERSEAADTAPAHGLYLERVRY